MVLPYFRQKSTISLRKIFGIKKSSSQQGFTLRSAKQSQTQFGFNFLNLMRKNSPSEAGFTLIELLVVVAIIGILTGIAVSSYNSFNNSQTIKIAALQVKSDLRKANFNALSGKKDLSASITPSNALDSGCKTNRYNNNDATGPYAFPGGLNDYVDDFTLTGWFLVFTNNKNASTDPRIPAGTPRNTFYYIASRCQAAPNLIGKYAPGQASPDSWVINVAYKKLPAGSEVYEIRGLTSSGGVFGGCIGIFICTVTAEYYTVNASPTKGIGVGFYQDATKTLSLLNGTFDGGTNDLLTPAWNTMPNTIVKLKILLRNPTNPNGPKYAINVENNGNVSECAFTGGVPC